MEKTKMFNYFVTWIYEDGDMRHFRTDCKEMALEVMAKLMRNIMIRRIDLDIRKK